MGQLITTVVGGFVGGLLGGPLGASIGMSLGGMLGATLFGPTIKGPRLNDLKVTASTYGVAIPEVYGTVRVGGNMIWTTGIKEVTKKSRAGKGGPKQETYTYNATFAMGICKGPITDILRIWADGKLIYDKSANAVRDIGTTPGGWLQIISKAKKKETLRFRLYKGDETQLPDSLIVADKGSGNVSAHRGLAYVVFEKLQLEDFGNRIPQFTFEVTKQISTNFPTVTATVSGSPPSGIDSKFWIPDWELGRVAAFDSTKTTVFDLTTMEAVNIGPAMGTSGDYLPGTGLYLQEIDASNSRRYQVWNMFTLTSQGRIGQQGNSLNGVYIDNDGNIREQYAALRKISNRVVNIGSGQRNILFWIGWTRSAWCLAYGESIPIFNAMSDFQPSDILCGRKSPSEAIFIPWRYTSTTFQFEVWRVGAYAKGEHYNKPDGTLAWKQSTDWSKSGTVTLTPFPGDTFTPVVILYDDSDDHIFVAGRLNNRLATFKYSPDTGTYKFAVKHPTIRPPVRRAKYSRIFGGTFGYAYTEYTQSGKLIQIDLQNGSIVQDYAFGNTWGDQLYFGDQQHWDDLSASMITESRDQYRRIAFRAGANQLSVASIISDVCLRTGVLTASDIDVTGLNTGNLVGYVIDRETTARDVLKQLGTAFLFDGYESDYKLKFKSRGNASVVTIPENWIGRNDDGIVVKETLTQELEMPLKITVNFYDTSRDHQQGSQSAKRKAGPIPTMWTRKEDIIDLPITWTPDDAKQCADKLLKMSWANRTAFEFSLPWRYLKYDPTDVATVNLENGTVYSVRLNEVTIGADFVVEANGVSEKSTAYVSAAKGSRSITSGQSISGTFPCFPIVINTPLLRDEDYNTTGNSICYLSVGTNALTFEGASIQMDDGLEYRNLGFISSDTITGYCLNALARTTAYESTDETTVLRVRLADPGHTLSSVTQDEMLAGANAALVGEEVIYFRDAALQSDGTWNLTGLLRARRGTNYAINSHKVNELFLLLDSEDVTAFQRSSQNYTVERDFKAVPTGTLGEDALPYRSSLVPRDLMPYTPEDNKISDDGTTVTLTTQRRSRVTAALTSGTGFIPYREGEKIDAKIKFEIWPGLDLTGVNTDTAPAITGSAPLFDNAGQDIEPVFTFPLTSLGGETKFLVKLYETGYVDGIPKWIAYERLGTNRWNFADLY